MLLELYYGKKINEYFGQPNTTPLSASSRVKLGTSTSHVESVKDKIHTKALENCELLHNIRKTGT